MNDMAGWQPADDIPSSRLFCVLAFLHVHSDSRSWQKHLNEFNNYLELARNMLHKQKELKFVFGTYFPYNLRKPGHNKLTIVIATGQDQVSMNFSLWNASPVEE